MSKQDSKVIRACLRKQNHRELGQASDTGRLQFVLCLFVAFVVVVVVVFSFLLIHIHVFIC